MTNRSNESHRLSSIWSVAPLALLRSAVDAVPSMKYALGVGGVAAVVAIVLIAWKLPPGMAVIGGIAVFVAMVVLVIFSALSATHPRTLRPLALTMGWSFLALTVATACLFVSCAFFNRPQNLRCLLRNEDCGGPDDGRAIANAVDGADAILKSLYAGDYETVYGHFSPAVKQFLPFAQFRAAARRQTSQLKGGPLLRRVRGEPKPEGGFLFVGFDAEFDEAARWIEGITYVKTAKGWELYGINMQPASWSNATATSKLLNESDPATVINNRGQGAVGYWTPQLGWRATVERNIGRRAERTCDLSLRAGTATVNARNVLGGCSLPAGTTIDLVGKVIAVGNGNLDLDEVKFQLEDV